MEEKKKTAREIIEGYDGPPVRIMKCAEPIHMRFSDLESGNFCQNRWN